MSVVHGAMPAGMHIVALHLVAGGAGAQVPGRVRRKVSLLRPVVLSTVSAITGQPAACDAVQDFLASVPGVRRVELIPDRPTQRFVDVFDAGRGGRGEDLQRAAGFGRARYGEFAVWMRTIFRRRWGTVKIGLL